MIDRHTDAEDNIALLIDADNASPDHFDEVLLVLGELGTINIRRAYGNWAKASLKGWGGLTGSHSIVPVQQFDVVKGKSVTDMRMTIDAMDLLYRGHVDGFGIMSSDSDFLPLAQRIREEGLPVYGFDADASGFFWCAGQGGFGIQTAPAAAKLAAGQLLNEETDVDATPFSPLRFR